MSAASGKAAFLLKTKTVSPSVKVDTPPPPKPLKLDSVFPPPKANRIDSNSSMKSGRNTSVITKTGAATSKEEPKTDPKATSVVETPPAPTENNETSVQPTADAEPSSPRAKYSGIKSAKARFMEEASKAANPTTTERPVIQPRKISPPREGVAIGVLENKPQERDPNIVCSGDGTVKDFRDIQARRLLSKFRDLESGKSFTVDDEDVDGTIANTDRRTSKDAVDISVNTRDLKYQFLKMATESQTVTGQKTSPVTDGSSEASQEARWASQAKERFMEEAKKVAVPKEKKRISLTGEEEVNKSQELSEGAQFTADARKRILQMQNEAATQDKPKKPPAMINIWEDLCEYSGVFENNPANRQGPSTTAPPPTIAPPQPEPKPEPPKAPEPTVNPSSSGSTKPGQPTSQKPVAAKQTQPPPQATATPTPVSTSQNLPSQPTQTQTSVKNAPPKFGGAAYGNLSNKGGALRRF